MRYCDYYDGVCRNCGHVTKHPQAFRACSGKMPARGLPIGKMVSRRLEKYGLKPKAGCSCKSKAAAFDSWGYHGVKANYQECVWMLAQNNPLLYLPAKMLLDSVLREAERHMGETKEPPQA